MLPIDTSVEAEYADGFILSETAQDDVSAYVECPIIDGVPTGPNTMNDILEKRPDAEHGKLVRFSVYYKDSRHDVDWRGLPDNARPIRFRNRNCSLNTATGEQKTWYDTLVFGYQYTDEDGRNVKEVREL